MLQLFNVYHTRPEEDICGYVDCFGVYTLVLEDRISNTCVRNISLEDFKKNFSVDDCVVILCGVVRQCFWTDIQFVKFIRAKVKMSGIKFELDLFIERSVKEYILGVEDVFEFTHCVLYTVCREAEVKCITLKFT